MRKSACFVLVLLLVLACGCSAPENGGGEVKIVASFYPVYIFTLNLIDGIDGVGAGCMTDSSVGCPHDYQLTPKDMKLLAGADLFVINGAGMEEFIDKAVSGVKNLKIADSSEGIELLPERAPLAGGGLAHGSEPNAHIWLSVPNAIRQVSNIYEALAALMPDKADELAANKERYTASLEALQAELSAAAGAVVSPVICFHDAYEYFFEEYKVPVLGYVESGEGIEPSAKELGVLRDMIFENGVKVMFAAPDYAGSAAGTLAAETGARIFVLDPCVSGEKIKTAYEDIMRQNLNTLINLAE